jgi:hypothetical protein
MKMKKLALIFLGLFIAAVFLSSCKSHERCPAYSKTSIQPQEEQG